MYFICSNNKYDKIILHGPCDPIRTISTHHDATTPDFIVGSNYFHNCGMEIVPKHDYPAHKQ